MSQVEVINKGKDPIVLVSQKGVVVTVTPETPFQFELRETCMMIPNPQETK